MKRGLIIGVWVFMLCNIFLLTPAGREEARARNANLRKITVEEARDLVAGYRGAPVVVLFYRSNCPKCRRVFDPFLKEGFKWREEGVHIAAFSVDSKTDRLQAYLHGKHLPFEPLILKRWKPGRLDQAMSKVGLDLGDTFGLPYMSVLDADGKVVVDGVHNLGAVMKAVEDSL